MVMVPEATIENHGFSMFLGQPTIGDDGFSNGFIPSLKSNGRDFLSH